MVILILTITAATVIYLKQRQELNPVSNSAATFTCDYYAAPAGTTTGNGSIGSPWDLQTALGQASLITTGKNLCLRGGVYNGKFSTGLTAGTVRSAPDEWAVIDGYKTTVLTASIDASTQTISVASTDGLVSGEVISIDTEVMQIETVQSGTSMFVNRGWGGSIGVAASHSSGATLIHVGNQLTVNSNNVTYRDFEVMNSYAQRDLEPGAITGQGCCGFYGSVRGAGIAQTSGTGNSYINLIIRDNLDGLFIGGSTSNTTVYGNLIYNNGGHYFDTGENREAGSGHGIYAENVSGYSRIYSNIVINNFNFNGQFYGVSAAYVGGDHQNNVFANAGSPLSGLTFPNLRNFNIIYGPNSAQSPTANIVNNHYFAPHNAFGGTPANLGYGAGIASATITGNYFVGGPATVAIGNINTMVAFTDNKIYGPLADTNINKPPALTVNAWNNNTYFDSGGRAVFYNGTDVLDFAGWKTSTGVDASSTETSVAMPDTVVVIPNSEETGRAHVVIYASSNPSAINVNLATTGLTDGQSFTIKNAFNYSGSAVYSGTYNASSPTISVPLTTAAVSVATPVGLGYTPVTTAPDFFTLIVTPGSGGSPTPVPTISSFTASPTSITSGNSSTLSWSVSGATSLSINQGVGTVTGSSRSVSPTATTTYALTATNSSGSSTATATVIVTSPSDTTSPTVSLTAPANAATVAGSGVAVTATATDNVGVAGVQFKIDGVNLSAEDTVSPYQVTWDSTTTSNGAHTLTAVARDAVGNNTTSTGVNVTVNNSVPVTQVDIPSISPNGGSFASSQLVVLSTATAGTAIYYTTDDTVPTIASTRYAGPFNVSTTTVVQAFAAKVGLTDSAVSKATFAISSAPPTGGGGGGGSSGGGGGGTTTPPPTATTGKRLINSSGTYYLVEGGYRKGVTSPGILYSCGFEFKDAKPPTSSDLALPSTFLLPCGGSLVKSSVDQTVYLISKGKRYAFTSASVFTGLGFKFSSVLLVTDPELQALPKADNLSNPSSAHLPETDVNINGTIYWIGPSLTKHAYTSAVIYNSWHKDNDFTTVVPANQNDLNLTTGTAVPFRVF